MPDWHQYRDISPGEKFAVFADTAVGGLDRCACQFLSVTKLDVPLVYHAPVIATIMTNALYPVLNQIARLTGYKPVVAYERNNGGAFEMDRMDSLNRENLFEVFQMPTIGQGTGEEATRRLGWDTNAATRPLMLGGLKEVIDRQLVTLYHPETVKELYSFVVVKTAANWKAQAEQGSHDDLVMALAGAWQVRLNVREFQPLFQGSEAAIFKGGDKSGWGRKIETVTAGAAPQPANRPKTWEPL